MMTIQVSDTFFYYLEKEKKEAYNKALEDVYSIIISDIEDKEKVLKIQELVFAKKGISSCESERI